MRVPVILYAAAVLLLFSFKEEEVTAQIVAPGVFSGGPLSYQYDGDSDDDIGLLLAVLLLAARNRGGGNNGCCCNYCNNVRTVPVPYPIPFPTNSAIIQRNNNDDVNESNNKPDQDKNEPTQVINFETINDDETKAGSVVKNKPVVNTSSSSSSSASTANGKKPAKGTNN